MPRSVLARHSGLALAAALALPAGVTAQTPEIAREGLGAHRAAMDALELKPAPKDWLAGLSDFSGGPAPTAMSLKGQVVLIVTWTSWHPPSVQALGRAGKLAESFAGKGLVVLAAHRAERFEQAVKIAADRGYKGLLAKDTALRTTLGADSDPNFYLIDRAGNLRYADLAGTSLEPAVTALLAETPDAAAKVASAAQTKGQAKSGVTTRDLAGSEQAGRRQPAVAFTAPPESAYKAAAWPAKNKGESEIQGTQLGLGGDDLQGKSAPGFAEILNAGLWLTPRPASLAGKVTIVYFWTPAVVPGYRFTPQVDEIQRNNLDDVVVIAATGSDVLGAGNTNAKDKVKQVQVERWLRENRSDLAYVWDEPDTVAKNFAANQIPQVYLISTDGTIRWQGHPLDKEFRKALDLVISVDPGIRARRAAEAALLSGKSADAAAKPPEPPAKAPAPAGKGGE